MSMKAKIYDGASWATRGKTIDWSKSPFIATFKDYKIDACIWNGNARFCRSDSEVNWWNKDRYDSLTSVQNRWNGWVKKNHMVYNYCQDNKRLHPPTHDLYNLKPKTTKDDEKAPAAGTFRIMLYKNCIFPTLSLDLE
ncbi:hypothetical protein ACFE04_029633 [Oxalis oulophora]